MKGKLEISQNCYPKRPKNESFLKAYLKAPAAGKSVDKIPKRWKVDCQLCRGWRWIARQGDHRLIDILDQKQLKAK